MPDGIEFTITVGDSKLSKMGSPVSARAIHFHTGDPFTVLDDGPKIPTLQLTIDPEKSGQGDTPRQGDPHRLTGRLRAKSPFEQSHLYMDVKLHGTVASVDQVEMVLDLTPSMPAEGLSHSKDDPLQLGLGVNSRPFIQNFELRETARLRLRRGGEGAGSIDPSFDTLHLVLRFASAFHSFPGNVQFPLEVAGKRFVTELTLEAGSLLDPQDRTVPAATAFKRSMRFPVGTACLKMFLADRVFPDKLSGPPVPTAPIPKGPIAPGTLGPRFPKKP